LGDGLAGVGVFPGKRNMQVYLAICLAGAAVSAAWVLRRRRVPG